MCPQPNQAEHIRQAWRDWWAGPRARPLVLQWRGLRRGPRSILLPGRLDEARLHLRYVAMRLVCLVPWSWLKVRLLRRMGVRIGRGVYIGPGVWLDAFFPQLIQLDDRVLLGIGCRLLTHEITAGAVRVGAVRVGAGSVVGAWSILRCGVSLGGGVTTGLGSVVVGDVADGLTVGGVPARPLRSAKEGV